TVFRLLTEHDVPPAPGAASDTVLAGVLLATVMTDPPDARSWPDPREVRTRADELAHASDLPTRVARIRAIHRSKPDDVRIAGLVMNNELDLSDPDALATVPVDPTRRPTRRRAAML
ncbi:MAG TPA: hypothetical protein VFH70_10200, partial [Acidimicrobiales bacterium]|nr:hypothetical protein [Acidimicrobiales bacterium]